MIDYKNKDLFWQSSVDKQLKLAFSGGDTVTNEDIYQESMEIKESLCSEEQLRFGCCEASQFKIRIANSFTSHIGQTLDVSMTLNGDTENPFKIGTYKVASDVPTADRIYRDITAYDSMYDIINADVSDWYEKILPNEKSEVSLKEFRDSFFEFLGVEQEECTLVNDNAKIKRTINTNEALSGKEVVCAICEINGVFGHIGRNGKFRYVTLKGLRDTLYPAKDLYPSKELYPAQPMYSVHIPTSMKKGCKYEDFECHQISKLVIREKAEDLGTIYGDGDNTYIIQGNFLVFGKGADEMSAIAKNIYDVIWDTRYLPANISSVGNPCIEVGDGLNIDTRFKTVYSYALQRTLKGIQALSDDFTATGREYYKEQVNGVSRQIEQLTSRTRTLTQSVESVKSEMTYKANAEEVKSEFEQTAEKIESKVSKGSVSSEISQESDKVTIKGDRLVIEATNFSLDKFGNVVIKGKITSGSTITGASINNGNGTFVVDANGRVTASSLNMSGGWISLTADSKNQARFSIENGNWKSTITPDGFHSSIDNLGLSAFGAELNSRNGYAVGSIALYYGSLDERNNSRFGWWGYDSLDGGSSPVFRTYTDAYAYSWGQASDKRLKDDIQSLNKKKSSDFIYSLNPCEYKMKNGNRKHHGFIAQEVQSVMKEDWGVFYEEKHNSEDKGNCGLRYTELIADLVATVQEQKREIEEMKSEIATLKGVR